MDNQGRGLLGGLAEAGGVIDAGAVDEDVDAAEVPNDGIDEALDGVDAGHVLAGFEAEILVSGQRRNAAEAVAAEEDGKRAEHEV